MFYIFNVWEHTKLSIKIFEMDSLSEIAFFYWSFLSMWDMPHDHVRKNKILTPLVPLAPKSHTWDMT